VEVTDANPKMELSSANWILPFQLTKNVDILVRTQKKSPTGGKVNNANQLFDSSQFILNNPTLSF
jgi:hypothetical protein